MASKTCACGFSIDDGTAQFCPECGLTLQSTRTEPDDHPVLRISNLSLTLPNGRVLFEGFSLDLQQGEVVVILGGSGAGKSTLARILFESSDLKQQGFMLDVDELDVDGSLGMVPQRGAPFDHLDVAENIGIALRHGSSDSGQEFDIEQWLQAVDLPPDLADPGVSVSSLSGGQAQRLAVARTLASGQRIVFLDEPSVGLDPLRVVSLAELIRHQSSESGVSMLVVTHDIQFACHVADRILFLDPQEKCLVPVLEDAWKGPVTDPNSEDTMQWRGRVEQEVFELLEKPPPDEHGDGQRTSLLAQGLKGAASVFGSFMVPGSVAFSLHGVVARYLPDVKTVFSRVFKNSMLRPLPFYLIVSILLGYTILYVIGRAMPEGLRVSKAVELVGGSYILALTPPICAFLFVATSGSAVNAWLGSMGLTKQTAALEALGISKKKYLWVPGWLGMTLAFYATVIIFGLGMLLGGAWQSYQAGLDNPWPVLFGDIIDPVPDRLVLRSRALWLVGIYGIGIATDVIYRGTLRKDRSDDVTKGMTHSIISCTLWVVFLELITALLIFPR